MWKFFTKHDTLVYYKSLQDFVSSYNHTVHRSIGLPPASVTWKNQEEVWQRLYGSSNIHVRKSKFQVGDRVRISKAKRTFKKGYLPSWTREVFTIVECRPTNPPVFVLQDEQGHVLQGTFYAKEIQKLRMSTKKVYKIEQVLGQRKKGKTTQYLVRWQGYPASFNSWLNARDLRKYKG